MGVFPIRMVGLRTLQVKSWGAEANKHFLRTVKCLRLLLSRSALNNDQIGTPSNIGYFFTPNIGICKGVSGSGVSRV
jgi:hypothetical protein